uniref:EB domain-containing protein n=1 Tax=Syphacia muris TaxID=451379 RepID=A0A0N5ADB4_9BILA
MLPIGNGCCCPLQLPSICLPSFAPAGCCCPTGGSACPPQAPPCAPYAQPAPQYSYAAPQPAGCGSGGCSPLYG